MPTKVLYISNYLDGTGWGNAAVMNILALDTAGVRVVPRAITFNGQAGKTNVPQRIRELESDDLSNIDVCIQHTLPTQFIYNSQFKNIGLYETETHDFHYSMWHKYINLLDEAWVPNSQALRASAMSGVKIPIKIAPHCIDFNSYRKIEKTATIGELENSFNFCFVGEFVARKNISTLLKAFHIEFHPSENVNLFLKLHIPGATSEQTLAEFNRMNNQITSGLKLRRKYKEPCIVTGMLDRKHLLSIMKQCHTFVCSSHGEAWCIPALEAMAMGMQVIYPRDSGMADFAWGLDVPCHQSHCYGAVDALPEIYTGYDLWDEISIPDLCSAMRAMYMLYQDDKNLWSKPPKERAAEYDLRTIGQQLKELL